MIPDAAVEAVAVILAGAECARIDRDSGYGDGENLTPEDLEIFMPISRDNAREILEAAAPHMAEYRQNEIQAEVLIHAMSVISQALATAEKWRYDRVCSDFQEMIDAAQAGKLRKP